MSKKMWHKIFKSKAQKQQQQQQLNKINKRHSRGIYEEYQQLNDLLNGEKSPALRLCSENENENGNCNSNSNSNCNSGNINVFEQQPQQSSFNSAALSEAQQQQLLAQQQQQQQQQTQQLSTFSRVRNTFSLRRNNNSSNNKKQTPNAKSTTMECSGAGQDQSDELCQPPPPLTTGLDVPPEEINNHKVELSACPNCSRTFNTNALRVHITVCDKMMKKRKPFDSSRQRREGTALSTYVLPKNFGLPNAEKAAGLHTPPAASRETSSVSSGSQPQEASPLPTRRRSQDSTDLQRSTARASMRKGSTTSTAGTENVQGTPQPAGRTMSRDRLRASRRAKEPAADRCPHCERTFNLKAFDRHVEWCKEKAIQANMKTTSTAETNKAKERMEARKQYKPPNLKTKRSINRDKYSGAQEEQGEPEMVATKQNLMSLSSMTSSVHSDNLHRNVAVKMQRSGSSLSKSKTSTTTTITQNKVSLRMGAEESCVENLEQRVQFGNPRRKSRETSQDIDDAMDRLRSLQVAKLDCETATPLKPAKSRPVIAQRSKAQTPPECLAGPPQATMTFDDLNGLIKRRGGTNICNIKMDIDEQVIKVPSKLQSSASLVRKACRRIRTRENPNIDVCSLEPPKPMSTINVASKESCHALPAPESFRCISNETMYFGSEEGDTSPRGEVQIKLERSTFQTVCRPNKKSQLPIITNNAEPMKALPMPEIKTNFLPRIDHSNGPQQHYEEEPDEDLDCGTELDEQETYDETDMEVGQLLSKAKLLEGDYDDYMDDVLYSEDEQLQLQPQILSPLRRTPTNVSRRLVLLEQDEDGTMYIKAPPSPTKRPPARLAINSERQLIESGCSPLVSDKYDPFLSAKRQLEELCSPNTPPDNEPVVVQPTTTTTTPPILMSTSLTSALGKVHNATTMTPTSTASGQKTTTPNSNFRRTSSLRGPRRTPLLPSRPLFASNYRPTIQRGLSDEGPISSNFLKPEEYDEMPVRAACVNDFHSPRVVRRDTSASNRKQHMKLPLSNATEQPARNVAKTDSLAVFLKYEHELEQLNAKAAELAAANSKELSSKELKEKSNNLSKQNSAKNLTANSGQLPPLLTTPICPPSQVAAAKENNENLVHNFATPLRLEPISGSKPLTPVAPSGTPMPIKLESIFSAYIDPKLINACDNLNVQQSSTGSSDASSTPQQITQSRSSSQSTITMGPEQRRHSGEARNLLKRKMRLGRNQFLYDASPEEAYISSGSCADDEGNRSSLEFDEQCWQQQQKQLLSNPLLGMTKMPVLPTFDDFDFEEFLSSFENENDEEQFPLFRDCREFLLNRTTSRQRSCQKATSTPQQPQSQSQTHTHTPTETATATLRSPAGTPPNSTPLNSSDENNTNNHNNNNNNNSHKLPRCTDESQKREIFISIETEANAQGHSPISPDSLRHMVGNAQTPIDVLHIENGNEPEHAKFSKISDNEDQFDAEHDDEPSHGRCTTKRLSSMPGPVATTTPISTSTLPSPSPSSLALPNVEANNAKNVIEKMRNDFQQLGEQAGASVRRDLLLRQEQALQKQHLQQMQTQQQELKLNAPLTPSPSGDSDELSSLDGYPMSSSHSSRRGASSKLSSDSAYGSSNSPYSLSRQRSSELQSGNSPRNQSQLRPHTASGTMSLQSGKQVANSGMMDVSTQAQTNFGTLKARQRMFAGNGLVSPAINDANAEYSSSSSEHSLPLQQQQQQQQQQNINYNYQQQQQQQQSQAQVAYNNNNNNYELNAKNLNNNNNNSSSSNNNNNNSVSCNLTPTTSLHSLASNNSNSSMTASMKLSKFCHECGGKFVIEHAKFCMDCGVRRVVL
ncbi:GH20883 [Drosophila grimshawi]|uniref:GH20883 n=1 Tax=Drosophila grimshawi TaxID=7222 RepID=B4J546_DROGR|nr:GH20883 [Drosophila grimshawi]